MRGGKKERKETKRQNYLGRGKDADVVRTEMRVADLAEPLGFDEIGEVLPELHRW